MSEVKKYIKERLVTERDEAIIALLNKEGRMIEVVGADETLLEFKVYYKWIFKRINFKKSYIKFKLVNTGTIRNMYDLYVFDK